MKYLGIDYGTKRIGLAVSDVSGRVAFPYCVLEVSDQSTSLIIQIIRREEVEKIVIGESKDFTMKDNNVMEQINNFKKELASKISTEIISHTELFTSSQISTEDHFAQTPREQNVRGEKKSENLDARSASLILQGYLDTINRK